MDSKLIGKIISKLEVSAAQEALRFTTTDNEVIYWVTDGDCCSESWFSEIIDYSPWGQTKVTKVEEINLPTYDDGKTRQDKDKFYGFRIHLEDSTPILIVFRNSSNGYYGGDLVETDKVSSKLDKWTLIKPEWGQWSAPGNG